MIDVLQYLNTIFLLYYWGMISSCDTTINKGNEHLEVLENLKIAEK
ncbi:hypothetical protein [Pseudobutyrivibrio xylanivorans]|nr:hypothetical protein [Pseudobutyrivibrio xylanivorans]